MIFNNWHLTFRSKEIKNNYFRFFAISVMYTCVFFAIIILMLLLFLLPALMLVDLLIRLCTRNKKKIIFYS
jgi:Flp pilus assembly protein TadB